VQTLGELVETAFREGWLPASRYRPMKSAVKRYAQLLGQDSAEQTSLDLAIRPQATIQQLFETHANPALLPESIANQWRSVWNLLEAAADHGLIPALPTTDQYDWKIRGNMHGGSRVHQHRWEGLRLGVYGFRRDEWPIDFAHECAQYIDWCKGDIVRGRPRRLHKVDSTTNHVLTTLGQLAGYALRQQGWDRESLSLSALCQASFLEEFCWWWIEKRRKQSTETIRTKLGHVHTIARHWLKDPENTQHITELFRRLDEQAPAIKVIDKKKRWLSLEELDRIARSANPRNESRLRHDKMARYIERHLTDPVKHGIV
jgi:hypothetical protein